MAILGGMMMIVIMGIVISCDRIYIYIYTYIYIYKHY